MAAAAMAARVAMMAKDGEGREEKTDEELLAEAEAELEAKTYNKYTDPKNYEGVMKKYVVFGNFMNEFIVGKYEKYFNNFVLLCICVAGVLVGMQTYDAYESDSTLESIDNFILYVFTIECFVKTFAEGAAPWKFFTNEEWKWNLFDFIVVVLCYPFAQPLTGGNAAVLRLMRLARLMKLLKKIQQLQMIVMGLLGGLSSIGYIVILLLLVFYLYAIVGVMYFAKNDPWHFGTLHIAMLSLFRASTLEDWTEMMYIAMYGCSDFQDIYCTETADISSCDWPTGLHKHMYQCVQHKAMPILSAGYWITFIVISALVMLSLFIGAVTMSMSESMEDMKVEAEENERKLRLLKKKERMRELEAKGENKVEDDDENITDTSRMGIRERAEHKNEVVMKALLLEAWEGVILSQTVEANYAPGLKGKYQRLAEKMDNLANHPTFVNVITGVIILAGVMVGMQTFPQFETDPILAVIDLIVLAIFTFECLVKFIAEEFQPWNFFKSGWNTFDFIVVAGSFMPAAGSLVTMLRLLRLLRVLKLLKAFPQLAIIVNALIMGLSSIGYIGVILMMVFYLFSILGMILFKENDPWHFGTLHTSMLTLFRASTLEDWTDIMYINIYGCALYGYDVTTDEGDEGRSCQVLGSKGPGAQFVAALYFVIFTLLGALVLLTLFIGVVTTSMEEAQERQDEEAELEGRIKEYSSGQELTDHTLANYRKVFQMLDVDDGGTVEEDELRAGLKSLGRNPTSEEMQAYMREVDEDDSGEIDLCEFIEFMTNMKGKKAGGGGGAGGGERERVNTPKPNRRGEEIQVTPDEHTPVQALNLKDMEGSDVSSEDEDRGGKKELKIGVVESIEMEALGKAGDLVIEEGTPMAREGKKYAVE